MYSTHTGPAGNFAYKENAFAVFANTFLPMIQATHAVLFGTADDGPLSQTTVAGSTVTVTSGTWRAGDISLGGSPINIPLAAGGPNCNSTQIADPGNR